MKNLPSFNLNGYRRLIRAFFDRGVTFCSANKFSSLGHNCVFLRHDIDFSLELVVPMASIEAEMGVESTYYVLLSGPYNPCSKVSIGAMRDLRRMGHSIGLHYDLSVYPLDKEAANRRLDSEVAFLSEISEGPVETIVMHEPSKGGDDIFLNSDIYVNPTFYRDKYKDRLMYVSDSCRAWRDDSLIRYLSREAMQDSILLNVHPESWLATNSQHRLTYLGETLYPKIIDPLNKYFLERVYSAWETHEGVVLGSGDEDE